MNLYIMSGADGNKITSAVRVVENALSIMDKANFQVQSIDGQIIIWLNDSKQEALFVALLNLLSIEYTVVVDEP